MAMASMVDNLDIQTKIKSGCECVEPVTAAVDSERARLSSGTMGQQPSSTKLEARASELFGAEGTVVLNISTSLSSSATSSSSASASPPSGSPVGRSGRRNVNDDGRSASDGNGDRGAGEADTGREVDAGAGAASGASSGTTGSNTQTAGTESEGGNGGGRTGRPVGTDGENVQSPQSASGEGSPPAVTITVDAPPTSPAIKTPDGDDSGDGDDDGDGNGDGDVKHSHGAGPAISISVESGDDGDDGDGSNSDVPIKTVAGRLLGAPRSMVRSNTLTQPPNLPVGSRGSAPSAAASETSNQPPQGVDSPLPGGRSVSSTEALLKKPATTGSCCECFDLVRGLFVCF